MAARFSGAGQAYDGLAEMTKSGPRWTGEVRLIEEHLEDPLRWKRPRRIFVNSMSDLFHESLPDADILRVFEVIRKCGAMDKGHVFQILTKRPERMYDFCCRLRFDPTEAGRLFLVPENLGYPFIYHLKECWLGVSVEDQKTADERIPWLLKTPAAVRWLSVEPMLNAINLAPWLEKECPVCTFTSNDPYCPMCNRLREQKISWVVVGGESGPGARPFDLQWARDTIAQCSAAGVKVFVKQLGAHPVDYGHSLRPKNQSLSKRNAKWIIKDKKGGDLNEWPEDLRVREYPL